METLTPQIFKQQILSFLSLQKKISLAMFVLIGVMFVIAPMSINTPILGLMALMLIINLASNKRDEEKIKNG